MEQFIRRGISVFYNYKLTVVQPVMAALFLTINPIVAVVVVVVVVVLLLLVVVVV